MKKILYIVLSCVLLISALLFSASAKDIKAVIPQINSVKNGIIHSDFSPVFSHKPESGLKKAETLPAKYDSRGKNVITSVKDQDIYGSCWAFSAIACAESSVLSENPGLKAENVNFSEAQHAYFTYNYAADPLNLTGDKTTLRYYNYLDAGGNAYMSTNTFSKWIGVSDESVAKYSNITPSVKLSSSKAYGKNSYILENAWWLESNDISGIKKMIMKYGAVSASCYIDDAFYNTKYNSMYSNVSTDGNHQITLVGWDDNFSKSKFGYNVKDLFGNTLLKLIQPKKNGAWIVKNSYGENEGEDGYFYLSYYDKSYLQDIVCAYDFQPTNTYDYNYQYDGSSYPSYLEGTTKMYGANVFTATSSQLLKAIGVFTMDDAATYKYQIYLNPTSTSKPASGTKVFDTYQTASLPYSGFATITLPKTIQLKKGDKFAVVLYTYNKGESVYMMTDLNGRADPEGIVTVTTSVKPGQSYVSDDGKTWKDVTKVKGGDNLKIKAFTTDIAKTITAIKTDKSEYTLSAGVSVTPKISITPKGINVSALTFKSSDTKIATVSTSGKITAKAPGTCTVTVYVTGNSKIKSTISVTVKPATPTGLTSSNITKNSVTLKWTAVSGATGYQVYEVTSSGSTKVQTLKATNITILGLKASSKHQYKVRAYYKSGDKVLYSGFTAAKSVTLKKGAVKKHPKKEWESPFGVIPNF